MGRAPCCDKTKVKRGPWSPEEDTILKNYIHRFGTGGNWIALPDKAGLRRCGKSCRLRWLNYLRPDIKHGGFTDEEDNIILTLYSNIGSRWSVIASHLPGRTDNDVKNYWNTKLKKKLQLSAANGTTSPQISKDKSNNNMNSNTTPDNVMHYFNSTQPSSPFESKVDNYYHYGNNSVFPNMSSATLQFPHYYQQQNVVPQSDPLAQVSLPSLIEVSQFGPSDQNGTFGATSSPQEASSLSPFESSGNGGGGSEDDVFLMGLVESGFYFDLLNGFDFQEN